MWKNPFEIKSKEEYDAHTRMIHQDAKNFIKREKIDYLIMGHTHQPLEDGRLFDCGDMIDSFSYVIVDNVKPRLEKMSSGHI